MRVLLMTWACDKEDISEPGVAYNWVAQISKDHDVTVFSISRPTRFGCVKEQFPELDVIEWSDIRVPKFLERFSSIVKPGYFSYYLKARSFLKKLIAENDFDVIHHISPFAFRYPSPASGLGVPLVRGPIAGGLPTPKELIKTVNEKFHPYKFLRNTDNFRKKYDPILRKSYQETNLTIVAVPYVLDVVSPLSINLPTIEIEHGMVHEVPERKIKIRKVGEPIQLLYVGRIIRTKGLRDTIRALKKTKTKIPIVLSVIGDGDDLEKCKSEAVDLLPNCEIKFLGWMPTEEVTKYYRKSDIFIFPSFREPTGGVLLEAMSQSLPCITCDYGGPGYIVDITCGILVPPSGEEEFASSIAKAVDLLCDDSELRHNMSRNARNRANELFVWDDKRKRISDIYDKACR